MALAYNVVGLCYLFVLPYLVAMTIPESSIQTKVSLDGIVAVISLQAINALSSSHKKH